MPPVPGLPDLAAAVTALQKEVADLTARLAALEATAVVRDRRLAELEVSDEASGWKRWREQRGGPRP